MRLYTRWLNLSQNLLLDVTNLRLFFFCEVSSQSECIFSFLRIVTDVVRKEKRKI